MELPENLDALTDRQKLDLVLRILAGRSERLDRFEAGLAALGRQVANQASVKLDRCAKHIDVAGGNCIGCFLAHNEELQRAVEFLTQGIRAAEDMLARTSNPQKTAGEVRRVLLGLLSPKVAGNVCKMCDRKVDYVLAEPNAPVPGPGVAGVEGFAFNPDTLEGSPAVVCLECNKKGPQAVQAPAPGGA